MNRMRGLVMAALLLCLGANVSHAQWVQTGPSPVQVNCIAVSGGNIYAGCGSPLGGVGIFLSTNGGASWTAVDSGLTNLWVTFLEVSGTNIFAGTYGGGVFLSTTYGTTWTAVSTGLTNVDINALAMSGPNLLAGTLDGLFLSTNSGSTWTLTSGLQMGGSVVNALAASGTRVFAGTDAGVFLSTNNGTSWTPDDSGLTFYKGSPIGISCLAVSPSETGDTNIFGGNSDGWGIFRSMNSGTSWTHASNGMTGEDIRAFSFSGKNVFAGTSGFVTGGVFLSSNNGESWSAVNDGLPSIYVVSLAVSDSNIFAGTDRGIFKRPLSEMITGLKPNAQKISAEFILGNNYPNPFNPSTIINYQLPVNSLVTLRVYDVLGRLVRTLVDERESAGSYSVTFNADGLAGGVYFFQMRAGSYIETKKMLFEK